MAASPTTSGPWIPSRLVRSDHAPLLLTLHCEAPAKSPTQQRRTRHKFSAPALQPDTKRVDRLLQDLIDSGPLAEDALRKALYGCALPGNAPGTIDIAVASHASKDHDAAAFVVLGQNFSQEHDVNEINTARFLWGPSPQSQKRDRAVLAGIVHALLRSPHDKAIRLFLPNENIIRTLVYDLPEWASLGWKKKSDKSDSIGRNTNSIPNLDLLKTIVDTLQTRLYAVDFIFEGNEEALELAKATAEGDGHEIALEMTEWTCDAERLQANQDQDAACKVKTAVQRRHKKLNKINVEELAKAALEGERSSPALKAIRKTLAGIARSSNFREGHLTTLDQYGKLKKALSKSLRCAKRKAQATTRENLIKCCRSNQYYSLLNRLRKPQHRSESSVKLADLKTHFSGLFQGAESEFFDDAERLLNCMTDENRPNSTKKLDSPAELSDPFEPEEISLKLATLSGRATASGADGFSYKQLARLDARRIATLFNSCLEDLDLCSSWLVAIICAIPKQGGSIDDPSNSRGISLLSCFLKLLTSLIDSRLQRWITRADLLPLSQNGFQAGKRTTNNPKTLRYMLDVATNEKKTLYIAFLDISKAFDRVHRPTLWAKMERMGASGPVFDILRVLYSKMEFCVRLDGEVSSVFSATHGILQGDSASPTLWNLYMADFQLEEDIDDPLLENVRVSHFEQADDTVVASYSVRGLQKHLDSFAKWCAGSSLTPNPKKTVVQTYRHQRARSGEQVNLQLNGVRIETVGKTERYIGITFTCSKADALSEHLDKQIIKAKQAGNSVFTLRTFIGSDDPMLLRQHYQQQVDPVLTWGAVVTAAASKQKIEEMQLVQTNFFRRALGVHMRSPVKATLGEFGVLPIANRLMILAIRDLAAVANLPNDHPTAAGARANCALHAAGKNCFHSILDRRLKEFDPELKIPKTLSEMTTEWAEAAEKAIRINWTERYHKDVEGMPSVLPLIQNRKGMAPVFQKYLKHASVTGRKALAKLRIGCHSLAVRLLKTSNNQRIERTHRLCRLCLSETEDEVHAHVTCTADTRLSYLREELWEKVEKIISAELPESPHDRLSFLVNSEDEKVIDLMIKFCAQIERIFKSKPLFDPMKVVLNSRAL